MTGLALRMRRVRMGRAASAVAALCCVATVARAAITARMPTDGYVRPGRYVPVEVRSDGPDTIDLTGGGCLPTRLTTRGGRRTVPVMVIGPATALQVGDAPPLPMRVPADGERLVGTLIGTPPGSGAALFPGDRVVPIRLDPADPLPGPPAAWEVLDGVVLDPPAMAALADDRRSALLAGGVRLAVAGAADPPDDRWPWRRAGPLWVLGRLPAGPAADIVVPDALIPTDAWSPDWPADVRRVFALLAGVVAVVTLATFCAAPRRWAAAAGVGVAVVAAAGVVAWRGRLDPVARGGGDVVVAGPGRWVQRDTYLFLRARLATTAAVPFDGWTHPVFADDAWVAPLAPRLTVSADSRLAWALHLPAGATAAFVRRTVSIGDPPSTTDGHDAALRALAPLYLGPGDRVGGETPPALGRWPGIVIRRP